MNIGEYKMSFIHFTDWFKKEPIMLGEARKKFTASTKQCDANPGSFKELESILGPIPKEPDVYDLFTKNKWNGFYIKNNGEILFVSPVSAKTNQDKEYAAVAQKTISKLNKDTCKLDGKGRLVITLSTGQECTIDFTGQGPKVAVSKNGEAVTSKYITNETEIQEAITACILNLKAKNIKVTGEISPRLASFIHDAKKIAKFTDFEKWMYSSSPLNNTGLCEYIDFGEVFDEQQEYAFQCELYSFLEGAWAKSFSAMYNSTSIMNELATIFKPKISNIGNTEFLHFKNILDGHPLAKTPIGPYLRDGRAGYSSKDTLDKTDIVWCLNGDVNETFKACNDLMNVKDGKTYCQFVNDLVANNIMIGISLKQIGKELHFAAVNFKTFTTASTLNINPNKKVLVKYFGPGNKENTFDWENATVYQRSAKGCILRVPITHSEHIHADVKYVEIRMGSNSSAPGSIMAEWGIPGFPARLGKFTKVLNEVLGFRLVTVRDMYVEQGLSWPDVYSKVADDLVEVIKSHPKELSKIFALGVGYPVQFSKNKQPELDSAPYIKIY